MNVVLKNCPVPIIWLDTSVIIDIAKYRENTQLSEVQQERISKLSDLIYKKTREGKLVYAEGDQREEINSLVKETQSTQSFLSMGIKFEYRKTIHDKQLYHFMMAYVGKEKTVKLNYKHAFDRDPVEEIRERKKDIKNGLIISVYSEVDDNELKQRAERKQRIVRGFEELRQENLKEGITYEKQLEREYTGLIQAYKVVINGLQNKINNGLDITYEDIAQMSMYTDLTAMWDSVRSSHEFMDFLTSEYYKSIPYVDIGCKLNAKIITSSKSIESGDSMDVEHLSTVIPYCNFVVTDRKMKNNISQLGLDKKYNTKVFCLKDTDELISQITAL